MPTKRHLKLALIASFALLLALPTMDLVAGPKKSKKKSSKKAATPRVVDPAISKVDGLRVLTLSGSARERGKTHGRALAGDIFKLIDELLKNEILSGGPEQYEAKLPQVSMSMSIPPIYREELEGMLEGIKEARKNKVRIKALKRDLKLEDLIALNALSDTAGFGCSSFGVWGEMSKGGDTIVARNLDWHYVPSVEKMQLVIVQKPDPDNNRLGWVSVAWPGQIGCLTGMNEEGVTVSIHDVNAGMPETMSGFTPRSLVLRDSIEHAHATSAEQDIMGVLKNHTVLVGSNIPVGVPFVEGMSFSPFMVFEYDGKRSMNGGVELNQADRMKSAAGAIEASSQLKTAQFGIATNHYCTRSEPSPCGRFSTLEKSLKEHFDAGKPLSPGDVFKLLGKVSMAPKKADSGLITYQSVVFEPKRKLMKIAFASKKLPATKTRQHSVNVLTLMK